ncbi:MAG: DNA polymerase I [Bacteroidia bacterium]|nr:DNA polymerase I [Bacteroidia bacterium]MCZ2249367.1 DNA polymerase I [Bacteroidia bacterium]
MNSNKLLLLDAFALIYRAYYALIKNPRVTSNGKNTNAQFGFTNTLIELLNKEKPSHMAIAFDSHGPTERHSDFEDYKANRQEAPEDLLLSIPDIKKIAQGFNIAILEYSGYEADDIIGTLAKKAEAEGFEVLMVTPDKDYGQLVSDKIRIYKPPAFGNKAEIIGEKEVCEKWGISSVSQVIDILGLMGDASDNIPGIPGVGEKTAVKLLNQYGTLENVLENAYLIKGSIGEKVRAGKEMAIMSKKLATIILNVPVEFNAEQFKVKEIDKEGLNRIFSELEFNTLGKRILGDSFTVVNSGVRPVKPGDLFNNEKNKEQTTIETATEEVVAYEGLTAEKNITNTPHEYMIVQGIDEVKKLIEVLMQQQLICFDTETTGLDTHTAEIVGMSFSVQKNKAWYVPFPELKESAEKLMQEFKTLFSKPDITWVGHNLKYDLLIIKHYGIEPKGNIFDTMLAHYLVDPDSRRNMDLLSIKYLGYEPVSIEELIGKKGKNQLSMRQVELHKIAEYAAEDADVTLQLKDVFEPLVKDKMVEDILYKIENPLVKVLTDMEFEGIKIDTDFLNNYSQELTKQAIESEENVFQQAGVRFNLASPKQLGEILFEHLNLDPKAKKTRTGQYATGEEVLLKLAGKHQIVNDILSFRELTKLKNTYVDALPLLVNTNTQRIHTSYNQALVNTGRLSSNNPNLQNIPVRTALGREIRKAFIARNSDYKLMSADYSQIELRIVAAISGDTNMCNAFKQSKDIHTATAAKVFNVPEEEVSKEMRYKAKSVNFGIIYGQGAFGLAQNLSISRTEAKELIDNYFLQYPAVKWYMDKQIAFAKTHGYVQTIWGRKRWLSDINSGNAVVRGFSERNAINMPIQGSAADMIKLAMINIHAKMNEMNLKSKMLLQVHDELVFDVHFSEIELLKNLVLTEMRTAMPLPNDVPVEAEVGIGSNWLEAH